MKKNKSDCLFINLNFFRRTKNSNKICHKNRRRVLKKNTGKTVLFQKIYQKNKKNYSEIDNIIIFNLFTFLFSEKFRKFFVIIEIFSFLSQIEKKKFLKNFLRAELIFEFSSSKPMELKVFPVYFFRTFSLKLCFFHLNSHPFLNFRKILFQQVNFLKRY